MLYDKRWDKPKVTTKPFTLPDFIAWLETQPPNARYNFDNCRGQCLMGLYMTHHGREWGYSMGLSHSNYWESCKQVFGNPCEVPVLCLEPYTFGAALKRARKALCPQDTRP